MLAQTGVDAGTGDVTISVNQSSAVLASAYTLVSQIAAQKIFNASANGALTLAVGVYDFECLFSVTNLSAGLSTFGFALAGSATFSQAWSAVAVKNTLTSNSQAYMTFNTSAQTALTPGELATQGVCHVRGVLTVTVAGTIIPQISQSAASAAIIGAGSFFLTTSRGTGATVGNWS